MLQRYLRDRMQLDVPEHGAERPFPVQFRGDSCWICSRALFGSGVNTPKGRVCTFSVLQVSLLQSPSAWLLCCSCPLLCNPGVLLLLGAFSRVQEDLCWTPILFSFSRLSLTS